MTKKITILLIALMALTACGSNNKTETEDKNIRVASHTEPMTTVIEIIKPLVEKEGYTVELVSVTDNTVGNTALNNKEIDANFFQHVPYMNTFNEKHNGTLTGITPIYDAIVGFYGKNIKSIDDIKENMTIGIPNDADNRGRALLILADQKLITLKDTTNYQSAQDDITSNPLNLKFQEVDLLVLNQAYDDVDLIYNYPSYIGKIGLTPNKDAAFVENSTGYYAISLIAREDNKDEEKIQILKKAMTSKKVKDFLENDKNAETLVPSF